MTAAGMKPARNSATADWLVTALMTIMKIAGGTSMPIAVPDAISEAASSDCSRHDAAAASAPS